MCPGSLALFPFHRQLFYCILTATDFNKNDRVVDAWLILPEVGVQQCFFWSSNSKKKLFWIYFWTKSARSAELFFGVFSFFLGFEPARSAGIIFWSFFLNKNRREAPIIFLSVFRANNSFLNKNDAKRRVFFEFIVFLGFEPARSAGIFLSFFWTTNRWIFWLFWSWTQNLKKNTVAGSASHNGT